MPWWQDIKHRFSWYPSAPLSLQSSQYYYKLNLSYSLDMPTNVGCLIPDIQRYETSTTHVIIISTVNYFANRRGWSKLQSCCRPCQFPLYSVMLWRENLPWVSYSIIVLSVPPVLLLHSRCSFLNMWSKRFDYHLLSQCFSAWALTSSSGPSRGPSRPQENLKWAWSIHCDE